jgi:hypothetical protein
MTDDDAPDPLSATLASTRDASVAPPGATLPLASPARYQIADEIGRGGLGRVLRARDAALDRPVAIKEALRGDPDTGRRFVREAMITARLQHPSIVPLYDAGRRHDDAPFYAMKLVEGRPLAELLAAAGTREARLRLLPHLLAVADAVGYAHGERIVHRDLKPQNVLVGAHGETVVIDWGLARDLAADDPDGEVAGTPAYMAPEQVNGAVVDARADVYALGAMLYELIAGVGPHRGDTVDDALRKIVAGEIAPLPGSTPRPLAAIVAKAMARAPADRYPDAGELAADLRRFMTDQLVGAHRYTLAERALRWLRRHRIAVAAVAALLGFAAWTWWSARRERDRAITAARRQLDVQVAGVQHDVANALDQAAPLLDGLRGLADPARPLDQIAPRMHDLAIGRPGVTNVSVGFGSGVFRGSFVADGELRIQESQPGGGGTTRRDYRITPAGLELIAERTTDYDVRDRPHYRLAAAERARVWTPPRIYFTSRTTGVTCAEPVLAADGAVVAVLTTDFDVGALSGVVAVPPIEGARSVVFTGDGTILAYPSRPPPEAAIREGRLVRHDDYGDPALSALLAAAGQPAGTRFLELDTGDGRYLAAVAPVGGRRAGVEVPLDWYVATLVPADQLRADDGDRTTVTLAVIAALVAIVVLASAYLTRRAPAS